MSRFRAEFDIEVAIPESASEADAARALKHCLASALQHTGMDMRRFDGVVRVVSIDLPEPDKLAELRAIVSNS